MFLFLACLTVIIFWSYRKYRRFKSDSERVLNYIRAHPKGGGDLHGRNIRKRLGISPGTIYVILSQLENKKLIRSSVSAESVMSLQHPNQIAQRAYLPVV